MAMRFGQVALVFLGAGCGAVVVTVLRASVSSGARPREREQELCLRALDRVLRNPQPLDFADGPDLLEDIIRRCCEVGIRERDLLAQFPRLRQGVRGNGRAAMPAGV